MAQIAFVRDTHILTKEAILTNIPATNAPSFTGGAGYYDVPADCLAIKGVQFNGMPLSKKSLKFLETHYSGGRNVEIRGVNRDFTQAWYKDVGAPRHWLFHNNHIRVYPIPASSTDTSATINYVPIPVLTAVNATTHQYEIPAAFEGAIYNYAAFLALSKEGGKTQDVEKSKIYLLRYNELVKSALEWTDSEIDIDDVVTMPFKV